MFSVKAISKDGSFVWLCFGGRYEFTKSKCEFLIQSAIRRGLHPDCSFEVAQ